MYEAAHLRCLFRGGIATCYRFCMRTLARTLGKGAIFDRLPQVQTSFWAPTELGRRGASSLVHLENFIQPGNQNIAQTQHFQMENQPETTTHIQKVCYLSSIVIHYITSGQSIWDDKVRCYWEHTPMGTHIENLRNIIIMRRKLLET